MSLVKCRLLYKMFLTVVNVTLIGGAVGGIVAVILLVTSGAVVVVFIR